jgi:hypothetical protein
MLTDGDGRAHVLEYLGQREASGGLDLVFTVVPETGDQRFWQCVQNELGRRGLANAECFGDGTMHQITLTVEPSAYAASVDALDGAITDASRDYLERVLPAHRAALAEAAERKARAAREAEMIDNALRSRFPGARAVPGTPGDI